MEFYASLMAIWISLAIMRYLKVRPGLAAQRDIVCGLAYEIGLTTRQIAEMKLVEGLQIGKWLEPLLAFLYVPPKLLSENIRFFKPLEDDYIRETAIETFRQIIYADEEHIPLLEAYEAKMESEAAKEYDTAIRH